MNEELRKAVLEFVERFECVFDSDWQFTDARLSDPGSRGCYIATNGTFLRPEGPEGDPENVWHWENRDALLPAYQKLKALLERVD